MPSAHCQEIEVTELETVVAGPALDAATVDSRAYATVSSARIGNLRLDNRPRTGHSDLDDTAI